MSGYQDGREYWQAHQLDRRDTLQPPDEAEGNARRSPTPLPLCAIQFLLYNDIIKYFFKGNEITEGKHILSGEPMITRDVITKTARKKEN